MNLLSALTAPKRIKNKQNHISEPFYPTDDVDADFRFMKSFYEGVVGKKPEYS